MPGERESEDWLALNAAALALYKVDHPEYEADTFESVTRLSTVTEYRYRAWVVWKALRDAPINAEDS